MDVRLQQCTVKHIILDKDWLITKGEPWECSELSSVWYTMFIDFNHWWSTNIFWYWIFRPWPHVLIFDITYSSCLLNVCLETWSIFVDYSSTGPIDFHQITRTCCSHSAPSFRRCRLPLPGATLPWFQPLHLPWCSSANLLIEMSVVENHTISVSKRSLQRYPSPENYCYITDPASSFLHILFYCFFPP